LKSQKDNDGAVQVARLHARNPKVGGGDDIFDT